MTKKPRKPIVWFNSDPSLMKELRKNVRTKRPAKLGATVRKALRRLKARNDG